MRAVIAGGGIGGLSAAIALRLRGWRVCVFERSPTLAEIGAGLQISPNGWRVIEALGVAGALAATAFEPEAIEMRLGATGRRVFRLPMKGHALRRWGAPFMHVHRADLVEALAARLRGLAPDAIRTGQAVSAFAPAGGIILENGDAHPADVVIGADGLHSVIRRQMLGPREPRFTGNVAWRAVVPTSALRRPPPPTACVWAGHRRHAVTTRLRAGGLANFVGVVERDEPRLGGGREEALAAFSGWDETILDLIEKAPRLDRWALLDRLPLRRWNEGRVALLGDAAHPMLPSMAQGAVQALEDAWVLARSLGGGGEVERALDRYCASRAGRVARVHAGSAANARMFHKASLAGRVGFYGPMAIGARLFPGLVHARHDWVYRHDVTAGS